jgi:hypothetical protein
VPLRRHATWRRRRIGPGRSLQIRYEDLLPGVNLHERTTTPEGLRLVPIETVERGRFRSKERDISPPWAKPVYHDPESAES